MNCTAFKTDSPFTKSNKNFLSIFGFMSLFEHINRLISET